MVYVVISVRKVRQSRRRPLLVTWPGILKELRLMVAHGDAIPSDASNKNALIHNCSSDHISKKFFTHFHIPTWDVEMSRVFVPLPQSCLFLLASEVLCVFFARTSASKTQTLLTCELKHFLAKHYPAAGREGGGRSRGESAQRSLIQSQSHPSL